MRKNLKTIMGTTMGIMFVIALFSGLAMGQASENGEIYI